MKKNELRHPELSLSDEESRRVMRDKTRRSFLVGGIAAIGAVGGYEWITHAPAEDDVPWPQRRGVGFDWRLSPSYFCDKHPIGTYPPPQGGGGETTREQWAGNPV